MDELQDKTDLPKLSSWNYRVMKTVYPDGFVSFSIHEVYMDSEGNPALWTGPIKPFADNLDDLKTEMKWMAEALDKPVLDFGDSSNEE